MSCDEAKLYRTFSALHEDTDKGWVWLCLDENRGFSSRMTIRISRPEVKQSIYCEYRALDDNFLRTYDASEDTTIIYFTTKHEASNRAIRVDLSNLGDVIVLSDWYRKGLGGFKTTARSGGVQSLKICKPWCSLWADLRAACQHPEPGVRVGTRVAILGTWLGVTALLPAIVEVEPIKSHLECYLHYPAIYALGLCVLFGFVCLFAGRGFER
jgi:hypothetical protein